MSVFDSVKWTRKAERWEAAYAAIDQPAILEAAQALSVFPVHGYPCKEFPDARPDYFVAGRPGAYFLVASSGPTPYGAGYARYIAALPVEWALAPGVTFTPAAVDGPPVQAGGSPYVVRAARRAAGRCEWCGEERHEGTTRECFFEFRS